MVLMIVHTLLCLVPMVMCFCHANLALVDASLNKLGCFWILVGERGGRCRSRGTRCSTAGGMPCSMMFVPMAIGGRASEWSGGCGWLVVGSIIESPCRP